jgi:hypothetical protein
MAQEAKYNAVPLENGIKIKIKIHLEVNGVKIMEVALHQIEIIVEGLLGVWPQRK